MSLFIPNQQATSLSTSADVTVVDIIRIMQCVGVVFMFVGGIKVREGLVLFFFFFFFLCLVYLTQWYSLPIHPFSLEFSYLLVFYF